MILEYLTAFTCDFENLSDFLTLTQKGQLHLFVKMNRCMVMDLGNVFNLFIFNDVEKFNLNELNLKKDQSAQQAVQQLHSTCV